MHLKDWKYGPEFLWHDENFWPDQSKVKNLICEELEFKTLSKKFLATQNDRNDPLEAISPVDKLVTSTSNWYNLKRKAAWLIKFKNLLLKRKKINSLSCIDIEEGGLAVIKFVQEQSFAEESKILATGKTLSRKSLNRKLTFLSINSAV